VTEIAVSWDALFVKNPFDNGGTKRMVVPGGMTMKFAVMSNIGTTQPTAKKYSLSYNYFLTGDGKLDANKISDWGTLYLSEKKTGSDEQIAVDPLKMPKASFPWLTVLIIVVAVIVVGVIVVVIVFRTFNIKMDVEEEESDEDEEETTEETEDDDDF